MHEDAALGSPGKGLLHRLLVKAENHDVDALPRAVDGFDQWINAVARLDHEFYQTRSPWPGAGLRLRAFTTQQRQLASKLQPRAQCRLRNG